MLYTYIAILLIVTSIFLGDALRRLRHQIINTNQLKIEQQTMRLHVFVMVFHALTFFLANVTLVSSNFFQNSKFAPLWNSTKMLMFIAQSISQIIIMYLIRQLSKPILVKKMETEEEDEIDESEASSFAFLLYMKKDSPHKMWKRQKSTLTWSDKSASKKDNGVTET